MKVAIVGAGMTGCLLAERLSSTDTDVTIFEKSRGCGGRASTKITDWGQCDLGATIVPAKTSAFQQFMQELCDQNLATQWPQKIYSVDTRANKPPRIKPSESRRMNFVFNHKMNAICRHWSKSANLRTQSLVTQIRHQVESGWQIKIDEKWHAEFFDKVVVCAPWPQSHGLIENSQLPIKLAKVTQEWTSCWSIALKVEQSTTDNIDLLYLKGLPLQTLVRDSAKPDRPEVIALDTSAQSEIWVCQLTNALSDDLTKAGKEQAISLAKKTFCDIFKVSESHLSHHIAHYWRYARPSVGQKPLGIISLPEVGFFAGGDWSYGASIESTHEAALMLHQVIQAK